MNNNNKKQYILYIKSKCPFCVRAIDLLRENKVNFKTISFDKRPKVLDEIKEIYSWPTVPMVFENSGDNNYKLVGGYTDLLSDINGGT